MTTSRKDPLSYGAGLALWKKTFATRRDQHGVMRMMAVADGYVMVRRPGALPFVMSREDWMALDG
jgi:hypothetical protein